MTRELKLALIVGFSLVLVVTVLISDHLSKARQVDLAEVSDRQPALVSAQIAEPAPAIPLPSERRPAPRLAHEDSGFGGAPPAMVPDIVQRQGGSVIARAEGTDPDQMLQQEILKSGGQIVDMGSHREIILDPIPAAHATSPLPPVPERTHTVADGDSLAKIAKKYYGDENAWRKLAAANPGLVVESLKIGTKVSLPPSEQITGKPTPPPTTLAMNQPAARPGLPPLAHPVKVTGKAEAAKNKTYVVREGDTVTEIARRQLGSPRRAAELVRLNSSVIEDEDTLQTGMVLRLPLS